MMTRHGWTVLLMFVTSTAFAQSDAEFAKANQEYTAGDFKSAIADYEALVQKQEYSANLFYDLGNAYFRDGEFGKAILNYERALALDRHHAEAAANLRIARDEARALELQAGPQRYLRFASVNQLSVAAAAAFWIALFAMFSRRRLVGVAALSIFLLAVAGAYWIDNACKDLAIITTKDVQARVATADNANSVLALPPGSEIRLMSQRGDWIYATLPNNLRGWIPAKSAERVRL